jgi:hypothetical protein
MDLKIVVVFLMLGSFLSGCIVNESITNWDVCFRIK